MNRTLLLTLIATTTACGLRRGDEDWEQWFDPGATYEVQEPLPFTDQPYDFPAAGEEGIGDLLADAFDFPRGYGTNVVAEDYPESFDACEEWYPSTELPRTITGMVTAHPRFYFKGTGCTRDDEKFYGSYFVEDATGGLFVLGDTKVAHFDMGDLVTLDIRATRTSFGVNMVYNAEVVSVERGPFPISYVEKNAPFGDDDVGRVRRLTGEVAVGADDFGEILVRPAGSTTPCDADNRNGCAVVQIDIELQRRGVTLEPGERVQLTGPVLYSFSTYSLVITRVGQIARLAD